MFKTYCHYECIRLLKRQGHTTTQPNYKKNLAAERKTVIYSKELLHHCNNNNIVMCTDALLATRKWYGSCTRWFSCFAPIMICIQTGVRVLLTPCYLWFLVCVIMIGYTRCLERIGFFIRGCMVKLLIFRMSKVEMYWYFIM